MGFLPLNPKAGLGSGKKSRDEVSQLICWQTLRALHCTFPDNTNPPAQRGQGFFIPDIPADIATYFLAPEFRTGFWPAKQRAIVPMPETAIHKQDCPVSRKDKIGPSRQFPVVQAIAKAAGMQMVSDQQLWLCVLAPDRSHIAAARLPVVNVSQLSGPVGAQIDLPVPQHVVS